MRQRLLVVEDESAIAEAIAHALGREGFEVQTAEDGESALRLAEASPPDLVILDLMLPGISGLDVCRLLRKRTSVPIIILTAKAAEVDKIVGLEVGADDYMTKPFSMRELVARARAMLRRQELASQMRTQPVFTDAHLQIDVEQPSVVVAGQSVMLSPRELSLLRALLEHRGTARTRQQLLEDAWGGDDYIDPRTVDVHVRWLRKKLEPDADHPQYVTTVRGVGYRFAK